MALYDPQQHRSHAFLYGSDPGVSSHSYSSLALWHLGYPDQALQASQRSLALAQTLTHPFSQAYALNVSAWLYQLRREERAAQRQAEAAIHFATKHEIPHWVSFGKIQRGWALAEQGQGTEGIAQISQGVADHRALGAESGLTMFLAVLSEAYRITEQSEDGLRVVTEALDTVDKKEECAYEAELYRLKGTLTLQKGASDWGLVTGATSPRALSPQPQDVKKVEQEAEECFRKAIEVAQKQQAKSLELRATMSLARLWQQQALEHGTESREQGVRSKESEVKSKEQEAQAKLAEAHHMLSKVYNWFTEGFDTKDLQEAKALLEELSQRKIT